MWIYVAGGIAPIAIGIVVGVAGYAIAWQVTAGVGILAAVPALLATKALRLKATTI
jgi:hypothetical protein